MGKTLYDIMKELGIKICPICGNEYQEASAISRKDNITEICPTCGQLEAIEDYLTENLKGKENDSKYCIFEKRICRFARKDDNTFECTAKKDIQMPCNKNK